MLSVPVATRVLRAPFWMRRGRPGILLIRAVVGELQIDPKIFSAQRRDDGLQVVAIFARYSHSIALNACLHLLFRVLDDAHNFLGFFSWNALLEADLLANALTGSRFQLAIS